MCVNSDVKNRLVGSTGSVRALHKVTRRRVLNSKTHKSKNQQFFFTNVHIFLSCTNIYIFKRRCSKCRLLVKKPLKITKQKKTTKREKRPYLSVFYVTCCSCCWSGCIDSLWNRLVKRRAKMCHTVSRSWPRLELNKSSSWPTLLRVVGFSSILSWICQKKIFFSLFFCSFSPKLLFLSLFLLL